MRVALLSDIHGNDVALRTVLADIHRQGVDQIVCLGDVATLGPTPQRTVELLVELNCPCIMGNHDAFLLDPGLVKAYTQATPVIDAIDWCREQLSREGFVVSEENVFALGDGDLIISKAFTWSGPVAAIAAVGVARSAYEYVLKWSKTYTAGGGKPILNHQAVGYALADVAMKIEACRAFSWKAAHYLDLYNSEGHAIGAMSKVLCGELMTSSVFKAMQAMGVNSLDRKHPIERYMRESMVFPLYDAGNIGMQMRKIWGVMADPEYDPRAIADSRPIEFKKSMEGWTAVAAA